MRSLVTAAVLLAVVTQLHAADPVEWRGQPFGTVARDRMTALAKGKTATIHGHGNDRYGRLLATVEIEGDDLGRRLVAEGLAWHYTRYSNAADLAAAERDAKAAKRGLWADPEPVPPWEWRASERERKAAPAAW